MQFDEGYFCPTMVHMGAGWDKLVRSARDWRNSDDLIGKALRNFIGTMPLPDHANEER
jgi:hypothetical protein